MIGAGWYLCVDRGGNRSNFRVVRELRLVMLVVRWRHQELFCPRHVDRVVKNVGRDVLEDVRVVRIQDFDIDRHRLRASEC